MPRIFIKLSKFITLGLMPFLLVSSSAFDLGYDKMPITEYFSLDIDHFDLESNLNTTFHITHTKNNYGASFNTIEIQLDKGCNENDYSMQFVISKGDNIDKWLPGVYEVSNINGLLKEFNGVFGVATIDKYGEAPFFAKKGSIHVEAISSDLLKGTLDVAMVSTEGIVVNVAGKFKAGF